MKIILILTFWTACSTASSELTCSISSMVWNFSGKPSRYLSTCTIDDQAVFSSNSTIKIYPEQSAETIWMKINAHVKYLPTNFAAAFPHVIAISIYVCAIGSVGDQFKGLQKLVRLDLGANRIKTIQDDAFVDNTELEWLYLNDNLLTYLNKEHFKFLHRLKLLDLHYNRIGVIDAETFKNLNALPSLNLQANVCIRRNFDSVTFQNIGRDLTNCTAEIEPKEDGPKPSFDINMNKTSTAFMENLIETLRNLTIQIENLTKENQNLKAAVTQGFDGAMKAEREISENYRKRISEQDQQLDKLTANLVAEKAKSKELKQNYVRCITNVE